MGVMGHLLKRGRPPADVMLWVRNEDSKRNPYAPCPRAAGKKFKFCHGEARQYRDDAAARSRRFAADAQVRRRQARYADEAVPRLRGALPLQRRLPEGSLRSVEGRRAGS